MFHPQLLHPSHIWVHSAQNDSVDHVQQVPVVSSVPLSACTAPTLQPAFEGEDRCELFYELFHKKGKVLHLFPVWKHVGLPS